MISPTIGRRVWYRPSAHDTSRMRDVPMAVHDPKQALDAGVVCVFGDRMVNLDVTDHNGIHHPRLSVTLVQEGDAIPPGAYAEWMPYQSNKAKEEIAVRQVLDIGTVAYADGSKATGVLPLPASSPEGAPQI